MPFTSTQNSLSIPHNLDSSSLYRLKWVSIELLRQERVQNKFAQLNYALMFSGEEHLQKICTLHAFLIIECYLYTPIYQTLIRKIIPSIASPVLGLALLKSMKITEQYTRKPYTTDVLVKDDTKRLSSENRPSRVLLPSAPLSVMSFNSFNVSSLIFTNSTSVKGMPTIFSGIPAQSQLVSSKGIIKLLLAIYAQSWSYVLVASVSYLLKLRSLHNFRQGRIAECWGNSKNFYFTLAL